jgi:hypothetical protein
MAHRACRLLTSSRAPPTSGQPIQTPAAPGAGGVSPVSAAFDRVRGGDFSAAALSWRVVEHFDSDGLDRNAGLSGRWRER